MKVAILWPGQERLFPIMKQNFKQWVSILQQSSERVDIFLHRPLRSYLVPYVTRDKKAYGFWKNYLGMSDEDFDITTDSYGMEYVPFTGEMMEYYNEFSSDRTHVQIEYEKGFDLIDNRLLLETDDQFTDVMRKKYYGHVHFFHSLDRCEKQRVEFEQKMGFRYNMVICSQPDIYYYRDSIINLMRNIGDEGVYVHGLRLDMGVPIIDRSFFGHGDMVSKLLDGIFENVVVRFYNAWLNKNQSFPEDKLHWLQTRFPKYGMILTTEMVDTINCSLSRMKIPSDYKAYFQRLLNTISEDDIRNKSWQFETHLGIQSLLTGCVVNSYPDKWYQMMFSAHGNNIRTVLETMDDHGKTFIPNNQHEELYDYLMVVRGNYDK